MAINHRDTAAAAAEAASTTVQLFVDVVRRALAVQ